MDAKENSGVSPLCIAGQPVHLVVYPSKKLTTFPPENRPFAPKKKGLWWHESIFQCLLLLVLGSVRHIKSYVELFNLVRKNKKSATFGWRIAESLDFKWRKGSWGAKLWENTRSKGTQWPIGMELWEWLPATRRRGTPKGRPPGHQAGFFGRSVHHPTPLRCDGRGWSSKYGAISQALVASPGRRKRQRTQQRMRRTGKVNFHWSFMSRLRFLN